MVIESRKTVLTPSDANAWNGAKDWKNLKRRGSQKIADQHKASGTKRAEKHVQVNRRAADTTTRLGERRGETIASKGKRPRTDAPKTKKGAPQAKPKGDLDNARAKLERIGKEFHQFTQSRMSHTAKQAPKHAAPPATPRGLADSASTKPPVTQPKTPTTAAHIFTAKAPVTATEHFVPATFKPDGSRATTKEGTPDGGKQAKPHAARKGKSTARPVVADVQPKTADAKGRHRGDGADVNGDKTPTTTAHADAKLPTTHGTAAGTAAAVASTEGKFVGTSVRADGVRTTGLRTKDPAAIRRGDKGKGAATATAAHTTARHASEAEDDAGVLELGDATVTDGEEDLYAVDDDSITRARNDGEQNFGRVRDASRRYARNVLQEPTRAEVMQRLAMYDEKIGRALDVTIQALDKRISGSVKEEVQELRMRMNAGDSVYGFGTRIG